MTSGDLVYQLKNEDTAPTEPAIWRGFTVAGFAGAVGLILQFVFPNMDEGLKSAILGLLTILIPIVTAFLIRNKVWSPNSVQRVVDQSVGNALRERGKTLPKRPTPSETPENYKPYGELLKEYPPDVEK